MGFISILFTAFALSMDAFAVSVTKGMSLEHLTKKNCLRIALFFGLFQGGMPLLGWFLGIRFESSIKSIDHWIALILLSFIGGKMILDFISEYKEGLNNNLSSDNNIIIDEGTVCGEISYISNKELLLLSVATSIDALAVGISFAFLNVDIVLPSLTIAIITFLMSFMGTFLGKNIGTLFKNYATLLGGIILVFIGINIFNSHTQFISSISNILF